MGESILDSAADDGLEITETAVLDVPKGDFPRL